MFAIINPKLLINALSFQIVWFICVQGNSLYAAFAILSLLVLHAIVFRVGMSTHIKSCLFLLAFCLVGFLGDSMIAYSLELTYTSDWNAQVFSVFSTLPTSPTFPIPEFSFLGPVWLLCLWIAFSITMNHSMAWLFKSPFMAFFAGLLFVPFSYIAGIKLSGSTLVAPYWQFFVLEGCWWALLLVGYQILHSNFMHSLSSCEASHV